MKKTKDNRKTNDVLARMRRIIGGDALPTSKTLRLVSHVKERVVLQTSMDRVVFGMKLLMLLRKRSQIVNNGCEMLTSKNSKAKVKKNSTFVKIRRIGSDSDYGEAHLVKNVDDPRKPMYLAVKILPLKMDSLNEIAMYKRFTPMVLKQQSPHFPIIIGTAKCDDCEFENINLHNNGKATTGCIYVFNELAKGDLKQWSEKEHPLPDYYSMMAQLLLSLTTLHASGLTHNDLHWGNMLYHEVPAGGYWHYNVSISVNSEVGKLFRLEEPQSIDLYVKNTGQQWVLWDFGMMDTNFDSKMNYDMWYISQVHEWAKRKNRKSFYPGVICSALENIHNIASMLGGMHTSDIVPLIMKDSIFPESAVTIGKLPLDTVLNANPYKIVL